MRQVNEKGEASDELPAVCGNPLNFDITGAIKPNTHNQITIHATRTFLNELGTGALLGTGVVLGPVFLYEK